MFPLAAITAAAISLANWSAVLGGGNAKLPVVPLLQAVRGAPADLVFYWIYLMLFSTLFPSLVHILGGLVGLALAYLQPVFKAALSALEIARTAKGEDITKDTLLRYLYPALAATCVTAFIALFWILGAAAPFVAAGLYKLAAWLLATVNWTARLFPA